MQSCFVAPGTTAAIKRLQEVMGIAVASTLRDRLIKCLGDEERWLVFVGPYEHHSNLLSWRQSLAEVVEIGLDDNGAIDIEDLRRRLESYKHANRPILGSFSACSNVTGIFSDTRGIARLLHQHGGFACFDFAASGPYVKIDMRSGEIDGYDAVFLSPHKFIGGPGTPGILLMSKALYQLGSSAPSTCGGGTVDFVNGFAEKHTLYVTEIEERENGGTPQIIQTIRAALTFWVKEYITYRVIEEKENMYTAKALNRLLPEQEYMGFSEEFEFILAAIEFIAIYGQRFLPLYHFNWKTGGWTFKKREFKDLADKENTSDDANKFASYLTRAKHIANLLHKFPSQREIPRDLDLSLLHFRV
ncbi:hypothetical protein OIU74_020925 [Salix koriyanagi]|uniref:Aminotransferase class V domain-containing protein n=1 Tax=Salix koriyanagi TaxID=2511006 RepID=A0A9Q0P725_9ROSI|nr:hypothetical protein OIU74_020925 [Salix koriyanagi]